ncbi:hypothetical protein [Bradyrhizobium sp. Gha]|uniref:hypothetical protein n=1 Tax=Bradyrhizobium sp. Gha TaxID=1855318 RepID=UPI0008DFE03C|nr:hypothetical protein [Bradyrhizobium sp. Gha]SFJ13076.1 hypothetical protein SAMN05216525_11918 [Bradyrhizobium sp. Gha]
MTTVRRGMRPWWLPVCGLALLASCAGVIGWMRHPPLTSSSPLVSADADADMPVPKQHNSISFKTTSMSGVEAPLRRGVETHVPAELGDVLAFYRTELRKRSWQETPDGAAVGAGHAQLAFVSPKGPATLKLGRAKDETTIELVQRNAEAAAKANVLPIAGHARLMFGYLVPDVAALAINGQTIEIAGGVNHPQTLDLPPGTYSYQLLLSGRTVASSTITVAAGEAWSLRLGDDDKKPDQIY